jgi:hypothetical protein
MHPAIAKRVKTLKEMHNYDPGPPLTAEYTNPDGLVECGFYGGIMKVYPELDEAWFVEEKELSFPK